MEITGSYRLPRFAHAQVADVMRTGTLTCPANAPLRAVARTMATHHIHSLVVTREGGDWALLSDLDLVRAMRSEHAEDLNAGDVAKGDAFTVTREDALEHAAKLMSQHDLCHLVVVDPDDGRPIGMLSSLDLAGALAWGDA
jgi:CBS domain-containing protein